MDSRSTAQVVNFAPTPELDLLRDTARSFLEEHYPLEQVRKIAEGEGFTREQWSEIAELGWSGLAVEEEYGGAGYGWVELGVLAEELGRALMPGPFLSSMVLATEAISACGTDRQKSDWLSGLVAGDSIGALAVFERPNGWSVNTIDTIAHQEDSGWRLDGSKRFVLEADLADFLLVSAQIPGGGIGLFVVDRSANGLSVSETPGLDTTRRLSEVCLNGVWVPADRLLGEGSAANGLAHTLRLGSVFQASEQVGGAQKCLEMSVDYAKTRFQFGRPIGSYQAIKHKCALMLVQSEHAKSAAQYAARVADHPQELLIAAPMVAASASEAYVWVAGETIQVFGGIGFTWEHDAHLFLKRAKASSLLLGDPHFHRNQLGDTLGL